MKAATCAALIVALSAGGVYAAGDGGPEPGDRRTNPIDGAEMVWIPGGEFARGSDPEEIDDRIFPWGNEYPLEAKCGNFADASAKRQFPNGFRTRVDIGWRLVEESASFRLIISGYDDGHGLTAPVGSYLANPFGLLDIEGNVSEWCADWYDKYPGSSVADERFGQKARVLRGGSFLDFAVYLRCADRFRRHPGCRYHNLGFRCVVLPGGGA